MTAILITAAFLAGMAAKRIGLPPMVGFLVAGFALRAGGMENSATLERAADFGVTLLLFTIGLKLKVKSLARPEVWAGTTLHMAATTGLMALVVLLLGRLDLPLFRDLAWQTSLLLGFALSFSSTVFAAKAFEERAELATRHAIAAIGILIMQDVIAVVFLTISSGRSPSPWAAALLALPFARPLMNALLVRVGHGELLLLFGFVMTFAGYSLFDALGLKGDLGAIAFGMLLASSPKAAELAKTLFGFKDLFLVGFFLSIGLSEDISLPAIAAALLLLPFIIPKALGYHGMLCAFRLRARPAFLASLGLANFSEFGLIVAYVAVKAGWLDSDWMVAIAVLVAFSFVAAAPLNSYPHLLFSRLARPLKALERSKHLPEDAPIPCGMPDAVIFGMGRIGTSVYDRLAESDKLRIIGIDSCPETVRTHRAEGRMVVLGDGTDPGFWERVDPNSRTRIGYIATRDFRASRRIAGRLLAFNPEAHITALATHEDEAAELRELGVKSVFDLYREAGTAFATESWQQLPAPTGKNA